MRSVLVVDDEPFVREALRRVLQGPALAIDVVADAEAALQTLRTRAYAMAIVDVIIPGMNGVELIALLKKDYPSMAIIAISGGGSMELDGYRPEGIATRAYLAAAQKAGADGVLAKPFEIAELEALVKPLLQRCASP